MSKQKLTRAHILRKAEEISKVLRQRPEFSQHFSFHKLRDADKEREYSRLGLAIPKKMAKRAVDRNRIKRIIRENFRQQIENPNENRDLVVKLRIAIGKKTKGRLRKAEQQEIGSQVKTYLSKDTNVESH